MTILLDTGPWVALLSKDDKHHAWAKQQFSSFPGPFVTCEAVATETCFLLASAKLDASKALTLVERGVIRIGMTLTDELTSVTALLRRYGNLPASLADACLVRMSELYEPSQVLTLDSDFHIYRRHGRKVVSVISPGAPALG